MLVNSIYKMSGCLSQPVPVPLDKTTFSNTGSVLFSITMVSACHSIALR